MKYCRTVDTGRVAKTLDENGSGIGAFFTGVCVNYFVLLHIWQKHFAHRRVARDLQWVPANRPNL